MRRLGFYDIVGKDFPVRKFCLAVLVILVLLDTYPVWKPDGYIVFSDLDFGLDDSTYPERIAGLFNHHFSSTNFFNLSRLAFILPFYLLSLIFGHAVPAFLLRAVIVGTLILAAVGMFILCEKLLLKNFGQFRNNYHYVGLIIPALFYALNPWVMFRIQHIFLLAGYACYPWVLRYFIDLFPSAEKDNGNGVQEVKLSLLGKKIVFGGEVWQEIVTCVKIAFFVGLGSAAIHYFFYYVLTFAFLGLAVFVHNVRTKRDFYGCMAGYVRKNLILCGSCLFFCAYWFLTYFVSVMSIKIEPQNVNVVDTIAMFSRYSTVPKVLYMVSYWWPMFDTDRYLDRWFWVGGGVFLAVIAYIVFYRYSWHFYVRMFTWAAVLTALLALGTNTDLVGELNVRLATEVPIVGHIFRDPNKLVGPMAAYFAVLVGFGVDRLIFVLRSAGFNRAVQVALVGVLTAALYFYHQPFHAIFIDGYYAGAKLPDEYREVQGHYLPGGKILWAPTMENMVLSNGIASYRWNKSSFLPGLLKSAGDFHVYSSRKPTVFQHENNYGTVSYLYSYVQHLLDTAGAHHLGRLLAWAGFNELGFHRDVQDQDERLAFNKKVLDNQEDMKRHYEDSVFALYSTGMKNAGEFNGAQRAVYLTKGLDAVLQVLELAEDMKVNPENTALIWVPGRKQEVSLTDRDIVIGDDRWDLLLPLVDGKYFVYPFDRVNTGNPYTGWAKTMAKEADWFWMLKVNHIANHGWDYDYGHGLAYTYTPYRLNISPYKPQQLSGEKILDMKDIIKSNFFKTDDPDVFKLTMFPERRNTGTVIAGEVCPRGQPGPVTWRIAKSELIRVLKGGNFISLQALISGVNAGKVHFKLHFLDKDRKELGVAYAAVPGEVADYERAPVRCDAYVPEGTEYISVELWSMQDTTRPVYFWVHDFALYVNYEKADNCLQLSVPEMSKSGRYRVLARVFRAEVGGRVAFVTSSGDVKVDLCSSKNRFEWVDIGNLELEDGTLRVIPQGGLVALNTLVMIPAEKFGAVISRAAGKLGGVQADLSYARDYELRVDVSLEGLGDIRLFPSSLDNSIVPVHSGTMVKKLDILRGGDFNFYVTGYIPPEARVTAEFKREGKTVAVLTPISEEFLKRSFTGRHCTVRYEENRYFLAFKPDINGKWRLARYFFGPVHLEKGTYTLSISVESPAPNLFDRTSLHFLEADEIRTSLRDEEDAAVALSAVVKERISLRQDKGAIYNTPFKSKLWLIYTGNRVAVKKGQLLVFRTGLQFSGLRNVHAKLMWLSSDGTLVKSQYVSDAGQKEVYALIESPVDGYLQPCFFARSDGESEGVFALDKAELYRVDDFVKVEGTLLLPANVPAQTGRAIIKENGPIVKVSNSEWLVQNEAFNPVWKFVTLRKKAAEPVLVNLICNGYRLERETIGITCLDPLLLVVYGAGLVLFATAHVLGVLVCLAERKREKQVSSPE